MKQAAVYTTNNVMITMGSDFQYEDAREVYKNVDKLMYYVNKMASLKVKLYASMSFSLYTYYTE